MTITYIVTIRDGLASRAVTDENNFYLGSINQLPNGRYEALVPGEANDEEPTFPTQAEAEAYLEKSHSVRRFASFCTGLKHTEVFDFKAYEVLDHGN